MQFALYRLTDRSKVLWSSHQTPSIPAFHELLQKFRRFIKMKHPMAVLEDVVKTLDDRWLLNSDKWNASFELLRIVFLYSGYDLVLEAEEADGPIR